MIERIKSLIHRVIRTSPLEHLILETLHYKESKVPEYKDIVKCYLKKEYHF